MPLKIFRYDETKYFQFGLRLGFANLLRNGFRLGVPKTLGKILQPVNSHTRFPEYHFMEHHIQQHLQCLNLTRRAKVLDVGSPKCFGLYLAYFFNIDIYFTDIYEPAVEECEILWNAIKDDARGKAIFSVQDARSLKYPQEAFDVVYSMSVVEHVGGEEGDSKSIQEMIRVLNRGGILLVTVPFGQMYIEQDRIGFEGAARRTGNGCRYFFQRIYTPTAVEERIREAAANATLHRVVTVCREPGLISRVHGHFGANARALLGCLNPILSAALNHTREGISPVTSSYSDLHSEADVYGDLMFAWEKDR